MNDTPSENEPLNFALEVIEYLRTAGYIAYWAGGCVRDMLLKIEPKDYDIATNATPKQIRDLFGRRRTLPIGVSFGVVAILGPNKRAGQIEVATFRSDVSYSDGRHPDQVQYSTPEMDAERRDFTINGLFYDPIQQKIIDYVDGQKDIQQGIVRAIGNANDRFKEDKLRMLRAIRFSARFGFQLEETTQQAICKMADQLDVVSAERIGAEMANMLTHSSRTQALELLLDCNLLKIVEPNADSIWFETREGNLWNNTLKILNHLQTNSTATAIASLFVLANSFTAKTLIEQLTKRYRLPNQITADAVAIRLQFEILKTASKQPWPVLQRVLISDTVNETLNLLVAATYPDSSEANYCRNKLSLSKDQLNPELLVTGDDLIREGLKPGKLFKTLLNKIRDAQLNGKISTPAEAINLAKQLNNKIK